jgi:hypothetical protein
MGELDTPDVPDDNASGGADETRRASGETPARTDRASRPEARDQGDDGSRTPSEGSERLTREEYANDIRGHDSPIPDDNQPDHDRPAADEPNRPADESRDADTGQDPAEPRDREVYDDEIRAESGDSGIDGTAAAEDQHTAGFNTSEAGGSGEPGTEPAEPRSRGEYADAIRGNDAQPAEMISAPGDADTFTAASNGTGAELVSDRVATAPAPGSPSDAEQPVGRGHDQPQAEPGPDAASPGGAPVEVDAAEASQDDRDRWHALYEEYLKDATTGRDQGVNVVGDKPDRSPGDTSDLPPTGEQLVNREKDEVSPFDKFRNELNKDFGDISDVVSEKAETVQQILERPRPISHPEVTVPAGPQIGPETPAHAIPDAGTVADIGLVLGVLGIQTVHWIRHKLDEVKGR